MRSRATACTASACVTDSEARRSPAREAQGGAGLRPPRLLQGVAATQHSLKHCDDCRLGAVDGRQGLIVLPAATEAAEQFDELLGGGHLRAGVLLFDVVLLTLGVHHV